MANMEFLYNNFVNTTTLVSVTTGTTSVSSLFDRNKTTYYTSDGCDSDLTVTTIRIGFSSSKNISRIVLENINFKCFKVYYNSNTANLFTLVGAATNASSWTQNSDTSLYLKFATVSAVSIVTIACTTTMVANEEKEIGELWITDKYYSMTYNPAASEFTPVFARKQYKHEMSDGGAMVYVVQDNFKCTIKRNYVASSEFTSLLALNQLYDSFVFVPFPTGTAWDEQPLGVYGVNWTNDFNFRYSQNYKGNGYSGDMTLEEISK